MLYLDGISINKLMEELKVLEGRTVSRIYQYSKLSLSLFFGKVNLYFSGNANLPLCYIKETKEESLDSPMNFSLNLRKYLVGSQLISIEQLGFDRILVFKFKKLNELGELKLFKLYFEIMGKHSNLIITDEKDIILDLAKKFSLEENKLRPLLPGVNYIQPVLEKKLNPSTISEEDFNAIPSDLLMRQIEGLGKHSANIISSYDDLKNLVTSKPTPKIYLKDRKVVLGSLVEFDHIKSTEIKSFSTVNEMINTYISLTKSSEKFSNLVSTLISEVNKSIKRNKKTLKILDKEMRKNEKYEASKEAGDILAANLFVVKRGMETIELFDFYNNCQRVITLDPKFNPKKNLDKYYQNFSKLKRGFEYNIKRYEEVETELEYLNNVKAFLDGSHDIEELESIQDELIQGKYIKKLQSKKKKKKKVVATKFLSLNYNGYEILYGRTNLENDHLTHKIAHREDLWLHAKDVPGGHVIIRNLGECPEDVIFKGAQIAAYLSKITPGEKVTIDYTLKKNLKKPKGSSPGFVIYHVFDSILVEKPESI